MTFSSRVIGIIDIDPPLQYCFGGDGDARDEVPEDAGEAAGAERREANRLPGRQAVGEAQEVHVTSADIEQLDRDLHDEAERIRGQVAELRRRRDAR